MGSLCGGAGKYGNPYGYPNAGYGAAPYGAAPYGSSVFPGAGTAVNGLNGPMVPVGPPQYTGMSPIPPTGYLPKRGCC